MRKRHRSSTLAAISLSAVIPAAIAATGTAPLSPSGVKIRGGAPDELPTLKLSESLGGLSIPSASELNRSADSRNAGDVGRSANSSHDDRSSLAIGTDHLTTLKLDRSIRASEFGSPLSTPAFVMAADAIEHRPRLFTRVSVSLAARSSSRSGATDDEPTDDLPSLDQLEGAPPPRSPAIRRSDEPRPVTRRNNEENDSLSGDWGLAPIPWTGTLASTLGFSQAGGEKTTSRSDSLNLNGNSYIWAPWFARAAASLSLVQSASSGTDKTKNTGIGGNASLNLFPASRFPFTANFDAFDSSGSSSSGSRSDVSLRSISLRQTYSPADGSFNSSADFLNSKTSAGVSGTNTFSRIGGNFSMPIRTEMPQSVDVSASYQVNKRAPDSGSSNYLSMQGRHSINMQDWYGLDFSSDVQYYANDSRDNLSASYSAKVIQMGTVANWIPDEDLPLQISGNLRLVQATLSAQSSADSGKQDNSTIFGGLSGSYRHSPRWESGANATLITTKDKDKSASLSIVSVRTNWMSELASQKLGDFTHSYNYGIGADATLMSGQAGESTIAGSFSAMQSLVRILDLGIAAPVNLGLNQNYGLRAQSGSLGVSHSLGHSATLNWSLLQGSGMQFNAQAMASDSRSFGSIRSDYQVLNTALAGSMSLGRFSFLTANIAGNLSRQNAQQTGREGETSQVQNGWQGSLVGTLTYQHSRFASVPGLIYTGTYTANYRPSPSNTGTDRGLGAGSLEHQLRQKLNWSAGRLSFTLDNVIVSIGGQRSVSLFLFVSRGFSGVL